MERYIARRCGNGPESDGAHRHSVHKELIVLRGTLKSARSRGTFRGVVADVVPPFKSGYTPRETYLTPDQFMALSRNLIVPRTNPRPATVAREHDRRIKRTLYGTAGNAVAQAAITDSVENPVDSTTDAVPRVGIEPTTRGFSVPGSSAPFDVSYCENREGSGSRRRPTK